MMLLMVTLPAPPTVRPNPEPVMVPALLRFSVNFSLASTAESSIVVTETVKFEFGPDSFTFVYRELPSKRTDGLTIVSASMDGVPMGRGKGPGQYEVTRDDNRRRIVWHFPATSSASHVFSVTYRAAGVVWQDANRDVFAWSLLPTKREYVDQLVPN